MNFLNEWNSIPHGAGALIMLFGVITVFALQLLHQDPFQHVQTHQH